MSHKQVHGYAIHISLHVTRWCMIIMIYIRITGALTAQRMLVCDEHPHPSMFQTAAGRTPFH